MPGFDGKDRAAALLHRGKGRKSDRRHVEAGILSGLGCLHDDSAAAGETAATLDAGIRALDGFDGHDRLILHDDRLPQIDRTDRLRRLETKSHIGHLRLRRLLFGEDLRPRHERLQILRLI